jgi:hypothetical protein
VRDRVPQTDQFCAFQIGKREVVAGLEREGFAVVPRVFDQRTCESVAERLEGSPFSGAGSRRLLLREWCRELAVRLRSSNQLLPCMPVDPVAVQCTIFEKTGSRNWLVPFHQDRSIPVLERISAKGLSGWCEKEGDLFVQPPASLLEQLTAVRMHIDPCPAESGALRVVPGSHRLGLLTSDAAADFRATAREVAVSASIGDALLMKPLLLHASSKSSAHARRRVLHFVFGPRKLPLGLKWRHAI